MTQELGKFKISICDGYVEYAFDYMLPTSLCINDIAQAIAGQFDTPMPEGTMRTFPVEPEGRTRTVS